MNTINIQYVSQEAYRALRDLKKWNGFTVAQCQADSVNAGAASRVTQHELYPRVTVNDGSEQSIGIEINGVVFVVRNS